MIEKIKYLTREICNHNGYSDAVEILDKSEFKYSEYQIDHWSNPEYEIYLYADPDVYVKYADHIGRISDLVQHYMNQSSNTYIRFVLIKPNYEKVSILNSEISISVTPWEDINNLQTELIKNMRAAVSSMDFQNIGNSSRTIMDKLARIVFDKEIHRPTVTVDVSNGKFKNQLHSYILFVLSGDQNSELRQFSKSAIDFTENAIDLMNQTTHKLDVQKHFAEICTISTISDINLIKTIREI